jgi:hypothetical protein
MLIWTEAFTGQRSCHVRYRYSFSKNKLLQTGMELSLFHKYINDLSEGRESVMGVKCLLYTHDLVLRYEIPKQNVAANTKRP